jgi:hypothetical protein
MFNISNLIQSYNTDWKNDTNFMSIINKHADNIENCLNREYNKYTII